MFEAPCPTCARVTQMLEIKEAASFLKCSHTSIYNWINKGNLHLMQQPGGRTVICKSSLVSPYVKRAGSGCRSKRIEVTVNSGTPPG